MKLQKLEIILSTAYLNELIELLEESGIQGYTAFEVSRGKGIKRGEHLAEGLLPVTRNSLVICIAEEETVIKALGKVNPYINERGGVLFVLDVLLASGFTKFE